MEAISCDPLLRELLLANPRIYEVCSEIRNRSSIVYKYYLPLEERPISNKEIRTYLVSILDTDVAFGKCEILEFHRRKIEYYEVARISLVRTQDESIAIQETSLVFSWHVIWNAE